MTGPLSQRSRQPALLTRTFILGVAAHAFSILVVATGFAVFALVYAKKYVVFIEAHNEYPNMKTNTLYAAKKQDQQCIANESLANILDDDARKLNIPAPPEAKLR
jgi:hypothetical protein